MYSNLVSRLKRSSLFKPLIFLKSLFNSPSSQNDESLILQNLLNQIPSTPKTFVEFGFSGWEFNCAQLCNSWSGLLLDGDVYNVTISDVVHNDNIRAIHTWLTLENFSIIIDWLRGRDLGVLSVDVDGNDYWFIEALLVIRPIIVIAEYNWVFGDRLITVPYSADFDRVSAHSSCNYYGASLSALSLLLSSRNYSLVHVCDSGINAFFVRNDYLVDGIEKLNPSQAYKEQAIAADLSTAERWNAIKHLDFVDVSGHISS
jgi:hypothetical protein